MTDYPFIGVRGAHTGDVQAGADELPGFWRRGILELGFAADMPLTGLSGHIKNVPIDSYKFNWFKRDPLNPIATITGVYSNSDLSSAYTYGGSSGQIIFVKCAQADCGHFIQGQQILLVDTTDPTKNCNAEAIASPVLNGTSSNIPLQLIETDPNTTVANNWTYLERLATINADNGVTPESIAYDATNISNYCQTYRNSIDLSRRGMREYDRAIANRYSQAKTDGLKLHAMDMEWSFLFGVPSIRAAGNKKYKTTTGGIIYAINQYASGNIFNFKTDTGDEYRGKTFVEAGRIFIMYKCMPQWGKYGSGDKLCVGGMGALTNLQRVIDERGMFDLVPNRTAWGLKVKAIDTTYCTLNLMRHPMLCRNDLHNNDLYVFEPNNMQFNYLLDTVFLEDANWRGQPMPTATSTRLGEGGRDGRQDQWMTDGGFQIDFPQTCGVAYNIGVDNTVQV